ncbi:phosphotransferase [Microbacterium testaceum]|uniref:phosphotransferase enzyme family protein n=1 Tax=Microbacterium testaceum TaxID=2033 RepID=UPI00343BC48A
MDLSSDTVAASARPVADGFDEVRLPADAIVDVLFRRFGSRATDVRALGAESAAVFRAEVEGDRPLAVKVFPADAASSNGVRWQHEVVDRLARAGLPVARPVRSAEGELTVALTYEARPLLLQVSDWLTGAPLERVAVTDGLLCEIGRTAARLHRLLERESVPADLPGHAWQITRSRETIDEAVTRTVMLRRRGRLPVDAGDVSRLERAADMVVALLEAEVTPRLERLPTGLVHHDLHDANLLVGPESAPTSITGILDFGDMVQDLRISEPVIAGAYAARHRPDSVAALEAVLSGWAETVPVTPDEAAVVLPLAAARLVANAAVWTSRLGTARGAYAASRRRGSLETAEALLHAARHTIDSGRILGAARP